MKAKLIVFDFDGVLIDSVALKNQAFAEIYREHFGELSEEIKKYLSENGGIERAKKFTHFYEQTQGRAPTQAELDRLSKLFTAKVKQVMIDRAMIPGVSQTLDELKKKNLPMYIASGAPHE